MTRTPFPLGRHVEHDPASRAFPARRAARRVSTVHRLYGGVLNQGQLGSCTGNALAHAVNTAMTKARPAGRLLRERDAVEAYSRATELDSFPGQYPPQDTGSSGLAVAKAGYGLGWLSGYRHAFGIDHVLDALTASAVIVGTPWYRGMFAADPQGFVAPSGPGDVVEGGHEWCLIGLDVEQEYVWAPQSWGPGWGVAPPWAPRGRAGYFRMRFAVLDRLLREEGDCTVPTLARAAA